MNYLVAIIMIIVSPVINAQTSTTTAISECRSLHFSKTNKKEFLECATDKDYYMPLWCEKMNKFPLVNHLKNAANFVDLHGGMELLSIGIVGEGFSKKKLLPGYEKLSKENFLEIAGPQIAKYGLEFRDGVWILKNSDGTTQTNNELVRSVFIEGYAGDSWPDDGTDTFGLEYDCLRARGLIPVEFSYGYTHKLQGTKLSDLPDFAISPLNDSLKRYRNESASRFSSTSTYNTDGTKSGASCDKDLSGKSNFLEKMGNIEERIGDPGRTFYRTPEAQAFANAALWKLSQDRFFAFKKELNINREFTKDEMAFWSKAFYNGAQGTQSGAFTMMKLYHDNGLLKEPGDAVGGYLHKWPKIGSPDIYFNARVTQETLRQTPKDCFSGYPEPSTDKKYTKATEIINEMRSSTNSSSTSGQSVGNQ